ncbi:hypothetical protein ElyMa_003065900 [Elysia marginata]|uniref:Uncharacterized protein n=1 Tax=Elysia marginata TaxID=1093978 RepID=A0AAV4IQ04_9GAST|nr:hypothetical protein ElyMa_003065900 [Elysia marginata]
MFNILRQRRTRVAERQAARLASSEICRFGASFHPSATRRVHRLGDRLCGLAVRHSLRDREVRGSIPGRVKPRTLKLVLEADPTSFWHYGFSAKSGGPLS